MPNIFDYNPQNIHPFPYWKWNKVLPAVYDDSLSQYEILCKLLHVVNNIIESTNSTGEQVEQLTQLVQQLIDGEFPSGLVDYVEDIVEAAMADEIETINQTIQQIMDDIAAYEDEMNASIDTLKYTHEQNRLLYGLQANYNPNGIILPMETFIDHNNNLFYTTADIQTSWVANSYDPDTNTSTPMDVRGVSDAGVNKFPGSCSSLVMTGLLGISYENSRYANGTATITQSGSNLYLTGGKNKPFAGSRLFSENTMAAAATKYGSLLGWLHSWQLGEYLYDIGLLHPIDDIRDLRPGDILFYDNWTGEAPHWNNINHCEVFCGFSSINGRIGLSIIQGQGTGVDYAVFATRDIEGTFVADNLKWFARIPSVGKPCENMVASIASNTISAAGWTNVTFSNELNPVDENRACTVIIDLDGWESSKDSCHFNIGLFDDISQATPFDGAYGIIYLNDNAWQIGPNTFATVCHTGSTYKGYRARINTVGTVNSPITIKDIKIYDGVVAY